MFENKISYDERYTPRVIPGAKRSFALGFPNDYYCGMSNLGLQAIYRAINSRGDTACERFFLEKESKPVLTIETRRAVRDFPIIGVSVSFEMDYFNLVTLLERIGIPLTSGERANDDPIVIGGGPCLTNNPEPIADLFDVIVIGDGEDAINDILDSYDAIDKSKYDRNAILKVLSTIEGIYIPRFVNSVKRRVAHDFEHRVPAASVIVSKDTEFSNMYLLEIARGCGRHCRFCMAGYSTRPPRVSPLNQLLPLLSKPVEDKLRIGLVGCAISDHPEIDELCRKITDRGLKFSVASLRADSVSDFMLNALAGCGHKTVTYAPEAGSERLRLVINKAISEEQLLDAVRRSLESGITNIRLYFMVGLPFEVDDDICAIIELTKKVKEIQKQHCNTGKLTLSVNPFVPKPNTPFQRLPYIDGAVLKKRYGLLKNAVKRLKGVEIKFEDERQAKVQAMLARGGRDLLTLIIEAAKSGGYKTWRRVLKDHGISEDELLRGFAADEPLTWAHIDCGVDSTFFEQEFQCAIREAYTAKCQPNCKKCGVCQ